MTIPSPLELIDRQISTLFTCDPDGRLRSIREPGYPQSKQEPAPRFFMGRTLEGNVWRFRYDLPESMVQEVARLCHAEPLAAHLAGDQPENANAIRTAFDRQAPIAREYRGPAYLIPEHVPPPANVTDITAANAHLLEAHFAWMLNEPGGYHVGPLVAVVEQGSAVSICSSARVTPWAAEAGVETAAGYRGRGYASRVVCGWAIAVRKQGQLALYSTWWENKSSLSVARKLGMLCYGEDWSIF